MRLPTTLEMIAWAENGACLAAVALALNLVGCVSYKYIVEFPDGYSTKTTIKSIGTNAVTAGDVTVLGTGISKNARAVIGDDSLEKVTGAVVKGLNPASGLVP